jgi:hypothetical protein
MEIERGARGLRECSVYMHQRRKGGTTIIYHASESTKGFRKLDGQAKGRSLSRSNLDPILPIPMFEYCDAWELEATEQKA